MKVGFTILLMTFLHFCYAQQTVNLVFVNKNSITENVKEADAFIVIKKFDTHFQRLDYKMHAPLLKERNYTDSTLTVLDGRYCEYHINGMLRLHGEYVNNFKENTWYNYNDTGKCILQKKYLHNDLIEIIDPDTLKKDQPPTDILKADEKEAMFGNGKNDWRQYLEKNLHGEEANFSLGGGEVRAMFIIDTVGKCTNIMLKKSKEFVLDEEAKRLIYISPPWNPAYQKGRKVRAFRIQPITFAKGE